MGKFPLNRVNQSVHKGNEYPPGKQVNHVKEWREKTRKMTDMVLQMERQLHPDESRDEIHRRVIGHARAALDAVPTREFHKVLDLDTGNGVEPTDVVSTPGVFRLVLDHAGFDRTSPTAAETFMDVVQKTLAKLA